MKEVPFLNLLAAAWIQFENHDWINHGENVPDEVHEIPLAEDDPFRERFRQSKLFVAKTQPDTHRLQSDALEGRIPASLGRSPARRNDRYVVCFFD